MPDIIPFPKAEKSNRLSSISNAFSSGKGSISNAFSSGKGSISNAFSSGKGSISNAFSSGKNIESKSNKQTHTNQTDSFSNVLNSLSSEAIYILYIIVMFSSTIIMLIRYKFDENNYTNSNTDPKIRKKNHLIASLFVAIEGVFVIAVLYSITALDPSYSTCQTPIFLAAFVILHLMSSIIQTRLLHKKTLVRADDIWITVIKVISFGAIVGLLQNNLNNNPATKQLNKVFIGCAVTLLVMWGFYFIRLDTTSVGAFIIFGLIGLCFVLFFILRHSSLTHTVCGRTLSLWPWPAPVFLSLSPIEQPSAQSSVTSAAPALARATARAFSSAASSRRKRLSASAAMSVPAVGSSA